MPANVERSEQPSTTLPSWETMIGKINLMTKNNHRRSRFIHRHQQLLRSFYDAWFDVATGNGREKLNTLTDQYANKESPTYNPRLLDQLGPYTSVIREGFPSTRTKR